ncbi:hypothetical protein GF359_03210 [candidate division WOR-3 bacterium]|uniref:Uncharacterized protein n=1 Tax=candidate division WOR-3 bacterium TaxID=2052148 RepID=A0A9D5K9Q6_UNCW3|nr:hypothetical protein [candidate division WOR-3 bacterium]MBD3364204.1 hypothetical protein [candidate division WOR-3 bacterium]
MFAKHKKLFVILGSALLLVAGVTVLFAATTDWSGGGGGTCYINGEWYRPWAYWEGELDDVSNTFEGTWDGIND